MSANGIDFDKVELQIGDGGSPEVFTRIAAIESFDGPEKTRPTYDKTTLYDAVAHKGVGIQDNGALTLNLKRETGDDEFAQLDADMDAATLRNFRIVNKAVSPAEYQEFGAYVTSLKTWGVNMNAAVTASATLTITGAITPGTES